jgi:hypothetical protein
MLTRRHFLTGAAGIAMTATVADALLGSRTIFLPPRGGWPQWMRYGSNADGSAMTREQWHAALGHLNNPLMTPEEMFEQSVRYVEGWYGKSLHASGIRIEP